jgi:hypothetical protein
MRTVSRRGTVAVMAFVFLLLVSACKPGFENPPQELEDADLLGTWEAEYGRQRTDRLELRADGKFKQTYKEHAEEESVFETPWNEWWLERRPDGLIRVYLDGARYFLDDPMMQALGLYDPFAREWLPPMKQLVLSVRMDRNGELLLHHMWTGSDRGFALMGGDREWFGRIAGP